MSSAVMSWGREVATVPRPALVYELPQDSFGGEEAYRLWIGILSKRQQRVLEYSQSVSADDVTLDSPNWLDSKVLALRSRGFRRLNSPRRRLP
jgi:hypothetical protein